MSNENDVKHRQAAEGSAAREGSTAIDPRTRILRATRELLAEVGWNRTTTRKVAERAGVNNALVNYYFGTKRALLLQAATDLLLEEFGGAFQALSSGKDLAEGVRDALAWLAESGPGASSGRVAADLMCQAVHDPALQESMRAMLREFRTAIGEQAAHQGFAADRARGLATVVGALLDGLYLHLLLDPGLDVSAATAALEPLWRKEER